MPTGEALRANRRWWQEIATPALLLLAAWGMATTAARWARPALLKLGPNDTGYVSGFRSEWERDGRTRFRWTSPQATLRLPVLVRGEGARLRLRARRHFPDPARVRLSVEGRTVAAFEIQAERRVPYRVREFALPRLAGRHAFTIDISSSIVNPRPLGIALDWVEVDRGSVASRFLILPGMALRLLLLVAVAYVAPRLAGLGAGLSAINGALMALAASLGTWWDIVAAERILREGWPAYAAAAVAAGVLVHWPWGRSALKLESARAAGVLTVLLLLAVATRLTLVLHPQFYYPDIHVHGMFAWHLARDGVEAFLRDFTTHQFRYSLGLQMENGHWYAFPYPPVFYLLTWPLTRFAAYRPEVAVSVLAAVVNAFEVWLVFGIARRMRLDAATSLATASAAVLLPIFMARLSLAYFPALVGHALDAAVLLYLLSHIDRLQRPRTIAALAGLLALALLTYTQSLLNFAILLPLFLLFELLWSRDSGARRRQLGLLAAGVLGASLALVVFYGRYIPIFLDMRHGIAMPEEQIVLEIFEQRERTASPDELAPETPDDPYAGPGIDLARGVKKAGWRVYIFYGVFSPLALLGFGLLLARLRGSLARLVMAWALTYLILNLASGGLPGPNLVRYHKDLEIVAPLFCISLGMLGTWLWGRSRLLALGYALAFWGFGAARAVRYLTERFVLER